MILTLLLKPPNPPHSHDHSTDTTTHFEDDWFKSSSL